MLANDLLAWYDAHRRTLPFRGTTDPYRIWVSEIMLQQTRTETVGAYFTRFMQRFPTVFALAAAPLEDVLKMWEGLGYYSRARNLHKAADILAAEYNGVFPADVALLQQLPGVGAYTAAAIASIAFDLPAPAIDGNLTRVISRVRGIREDVGMPSVKRQLSEYANQMMPATRCGDFNQALMDIGATICTPGTPGCAACPLVAHCDAYAKGDADMLPIKAAAQPPRPVQVSVLLVTCGDRILMRQRKEALLSGLWVYLLLEETPSRAAMAKELKRLGITATYQQPLCEARHVFTHRIWNMALHHYISETCTPLPGSRWVTLGEMEALPLPTAMRVAKQCARDLLSERKEQP